MKKNYCYVYYSYNMIKIVREKNNVSTILANSNLTKK